MRRRLLGLSVALTLTASAGAADNPKPAADAPKKGEAKSPAGQFARLAKDFDEIERKYGEELDKVSTDEARRAANKDHDKKIDAWYHQTRALIRKYPSDPAALAAIEKFLDGWGRGWGHELDKTGAIIHELTRIVRKYHLSNPGLGQLVPHFAASDDKDAQALAVELAEKHPNRTIRGQAALAVGEYAKAWLIREIEFWEQQPRRLAERSAREIESAIRSALPKADKYLTLAAMRYADVRGTQGGAAIGPRAKAELAGVKNIPNLLTGAVAPDIVGEDLDGVKFKLSDYRGKVVVLDFWGDW